MRVRYDLASISVLQQTISGTGVFNGAEVGRASRAFGAGAAALTFRARFLGVDGNALKVALVNSGGTRNKTTVKLEGDTHKVLLRATVGVIDATADEVADAVNTSDLPFWCHPGGTDPVVAAAVQTFAGGLDPAARYESQYRLSAATNANGGLFFFDHEEPVLVREVSGNLSLGGDTPVSIEVVPLTAGLEPISNEAVVVHAETVAALQPTFCFSEQFVLPRGMALRVNCNDQGRVRVLFHRVPRDVNLGVF